MSIEVGSAKQEVQQEKNRVTQDLDQREARTKQQVGLGLLGLGLGLLGLGLGLGLGIS